MYDAGKILFGLLVLAGLTTLPVWYNVARGKAGPQPQLTVGTTEKQCVLPTAEMRAGHMALLDEWRTRVVRHGEHATRTSGGREVRMSLTNTCLGCHAQKDQFCDRCHDYAAVKLTCFECHVVPKRSK
ncbi:MAG: sulfate reduction electron transfer complex DsrMKJOP subunit DsrJ [Deltaproteobacteria bacterium]|nr:sulfate reduction electron transfer complex DsrMKJOP subunit DsrJ [Deltaproteobacteria bacterium]